MIVSALALEWDEFQPIALNESINIEVLKGTQYFDPGARLGPVSATFTCQTFAGTGAKPNSVHELRPADISVIGAIGDSLTVIKRKFLVLLLTHLINQGCFVF